MKRQGNKAHQGKARKGKGGLQDQPQDADPNTLWEEWKEKFLLVADMHAPPVTRRMRVSMNHG